METGWRVYLWLLPPPVMKRTPLRKVSTKQAARLREYAKKRKVFLVTHPFCQFEETGKSAGTEYPIPCIAQATDVHHRKRRGQFLCDESTFLATCRFHHAWIHDNVAESKERGYLL